MLNKKDDHISSELDLEKQRIGNRLASLESTFSAWMATSELRMKQHDIIVEKLSHIILGNGQIGLAEKVRDVQGKQENKEKHTFLVWLALIPVIAERIWSHIFK